jgi:hypothetical protein
MNMSKGQLAASIALGYVLYKLAKPYVMNLTGG